MMSPQIYFSEAQVRAEHAAIAEWAKELNVSFGDALVRCLVGAAIANGAPRPSSLHPGGCSPLTSQSATTSLKRKSLTAYGCPFHSPFAPSRSLSLSAPGKRRQSS